MSTKINMSAWEYRQYTFEAWDSQLCWAYQATQDRRFDRYVAPVAQNYFWQTAEQRIRAQLDAWAHEGWEPTEAVASDAIVLEKLEQIEAAIGLESIFLWIVTCGIALIIQCLVGIQPRRYVVYKPKQFRMEMRRAQCVTVPIQREVLTLPVKAPSIYP
ncbi:MAG: hypothetical protein KF716_21915 [Anaerolineae bacterium]|nr:hypothetical protein [Anaerolineae bacterium]